jgi:protein-disulfide isomerase
MSTRFASAAALVALSLPFSSAIAQQQVPQVPAAPASQAPSDAPQAPSAPVPQAPVFPKVDPANFTASAPTKEAVDEFLRVSLGFDDQRIWQVQAIMKTEIDGISKVVVMLGDKSGKQKMSSVHFFALADGKHIIAGDEILPFGAHPFADYRSELQKRADGPYRGSPRKDLELVEFADFQCPHCKDAQANMEKLAVDFPKARIVFQNYPLAAIHPSAVTAATYGYCVSKLAGSDAFFSYASAVFEGQDGLKSSDGATLTLNSAVTKAGLDPAKVAACVTSADAGANVQASVKLAEDMKISSTPTLMVNGRQIPIGGISYDVLKQIVQYQAQLDGVGN